MTTTRQIQQLFEQHYQMLFRQAFSMLHDAEESRDMVHDVFAYLLQHPFMTLKKETAEKYLRTSVRNRCLNVMRNRQIQMRISRMYLLEQDGEFLPIAPDEDELGMLQQAMEHLEPPTCRDVVRMHFDEGMKFREIAAHLQVSERMVYRHLRHALQQLRSTLKNMEP